MIETKVEGSPASIRAAATFLGETLKKQIGNAGDSAAKARRVASGHWEGSASEAYRSFAGKVVDASDAQEDDAAKAEEKFRTCAGKLERLQERMGNRRGGARGGGLTVTGTTITEPSPAVRPDDLPAGSSEAESLAWDEKNDAFEEANAKIVLYNQIAHDVEDDRKNFADWVSANLDSFTSVQDPPLSSYLLDQLKKLPATAMMFSLQHNELKLDEHAKHYEGESSRLRTEASDARKGLRSGNPAVHAAAEKVDIRGNRALAEGLDVAAGGAKRLAKGLPIIGTALTFGLAGNDIANGKSPGQVITSEGLAIAAGAGVVVVAGVVGAPVIATAIVATGVAVGVSMAAEYAWDHWVPEDVTEAIDEGLEDFGEGVKDVASDTWDAVTPW